MRTTLDIDARALTELKKVQQKEGKFLSLRISGQLG